MCTKWISRVCWAENRWVTHIYFVLQNLFNWLADSSRGAATWIWYALCGIKTINLVIIHIYNMPNIILLRLGEYDSQFLFPKTSPYSPLVQVVLVLLPLQAPQEDPRKVERKIHFQHQKIISNSMGIHVYRTKWNPE